MRRRRRRSGVVVPFKAKVMDERDATRNTIYHKRGTVMQRRLMTQKNPLNILTQPQTFSSLVPMCQSYSLKKSRACGYTMLSRGRFGRPFDF